VRGAGRYESYAFLSEHSLLAVSTPDSGERQADSFSPPAWQQTEIPSTALTERLAMIDRLIEFSLRNKFIIFMLWIGIAGWGLWAMLRAPIDAIPDLSDNQVIVFTDWQGRSPQEAAPAWVCVSAELRAYR
jgi:hypothetical protein